ncbi:hypothetical protein GQX74_006781 [Glossina fuscipes]|nr:hypothetical protein GQX74_006781 [Glossina fuscipes]
MLVKILKRLIKNILLNSFFQNGLCIRASCLTENISNVAPVTWA